MSLRALLVCQDEKILRVLRRVLSDQEISAEECPSADAALHKLTRQRYECVIVDCHDEHSASQVLRSVRSAPVNKNAIAVAIIDGQKAVHSAFALGAHFVLYLPITAERAKTSFRAARALMKCERRRNTRVPIEIPIALAFVHSGEKVNGTTSDLSEGGVAVRFVRRQKPGPLKITFTLPGNDSPIETAAEIAWENGGALCGLRFVELQSEHRNWLKAWLVKHSPEIEAEDPPVPCSLSDLSLGGCYLETKTPFPRRTKVSLCMRIAKAQAGVEGTVRVMHPEVGMGIEFTRSNDAEKKQVEDFIQALMANPGAVPDLQVKPEGMDQADSSDAKISGPEDPLLDLFRNAELPTDAFLGELRKQRSAPAPKAQAAAAN